LLKQTKKKKKKEDKRTKGSEEFTQRYCKLPAANKKDQRLY
jgi:hypothetical protein